MATTAVNLQETDAAGIEVTETAVSSGNTYTVVNRRPVLLLFVNGSTAGDATVQGAAEQSVHGAVSETVTLGASKTVVAGPFDPGVYGESLSVTVTQTGSLAAIELPLEGRPAI